MKVNRKKPARKKSEHSSKKRPHGIFISLTNSEMKSVLSNRNYGDSLASVARKMMFAPRKD